MRGFLRGTCVPDNYQTPTPPTGVMLQAVGDAPPGEYLSEAGQPEGSPRCPLGEVSTETDHPEGPAASLVSPRPCPSTRLGVMGADCAPSLAGKRQQEPTLGFSLERAGDFTGREFGYFVELFDSRCPDWEQ